MLELKKRYGNWALVTGGTSGIGLALCRQLAREGLDLVLVARTQKALDEQSASLQKEFGITVRGVAADLSVPAGLATVTEAVKDLEIAILVPCAAIEGRGYFVDDALERHQALVQMDVVAPMTLVQHFGALMARRGRGAILLVSSLSGWMAQPYMAHYGAAKAYVTSLGDSLHHEMKDKGVDVSVLTPGPTETPMAAATGIDFASMGMAVMQPDPVARAGLSALGHRAHAIPGMRNRVMAFFMVRVMPRWLVGFMFKKMMGQALRIGQASPAAVG